MKDDYLLDAILNFKTTADLQSLIHTIDLSQLPNVLTARDKYNSNALMLAAQHPAAVTSILTVVNHLGQAKQVEVLTETIATRYHPAAVTSSILAAVDRLPQEQKVEVLTKMLTAKNTDDWNALMIAAGYQPAAVDGILSRYTVAMIATDASLGKRLLTLPDSEAKQHVLSLSQFIKLNRIPSTKQLQVVKDWFSAVDTSKEEKAALLRRKPTQVAKLILDAKESGMNLETKALQLLLLLDHSQMDFVSDAIQSIYDRLLKEQGEVKTAAQAVMHIYKSRNKPLKSSRPSVLAPRKGQKRTDDGMELDSFTSTAGSGTK